MSLEEINRFALNIANKHDLSFAARVEIEEVVAKMCQRGLCFESAREAAEKIIESVLKS